MTLTLVIANKNYSSWSLRPWIAMKVAGIPFEERQISLSDPDFKRRMVELSPTGKVPVLIDDDMHVWESIAILEHLAERFPEAGLWPREPHARAHARSMAAEMHASFPALRTECAMNMWRPVKSRALSAQAAAEVARIDAMWADCRQKFGGEGPFLCGRFSAVDAMYAPVVSRFVSYDIQVGAVSRSYIEAVTAVPAYEEWRQAAIREPWVLPEDEPDWPVVLRG